MGLEIVVGQLPHFIKETLEIQREKQICPRSFNSMFRPWIRPINVFAPLKVDPMCGFLACLIFVFGMNMYLFTLSEVGLKHFSHTTFLWCSYYRCQKMSQQSKRTVTLLNQENLQDYWNKTSVDFQFPPVTISTWSLFVWSTLCCMRTCFSARFLGNSDQVALCILP